MVDRLSEASPGEYAVMQSDGLRVLGRLRATSAFVLIALVSSPCGGSSEDTGVVQRREAAGPTTTPANTESATYGTAEMINGQFVVRIEEVVRTAITVAGADVYHVVEKTLSRVQELLPGPRAAINITADPRSVIPEVAVGGFTNPSNGEVSIWLDLRNRDRLLAAVNVWLPEAITHEIHHQRRLAHLAQPWSTLGDALVTEGMAVMFAREAYDSSPLQPWANALDREQERRLWELAQPQLAKANREHERWFFGRGDLPRWAGYTLGARVVASYLRKHPGETVASLVAVSADRIIRESEYEP